MNTTIRLLTLATALALGLATAPTVALAAPGGYSSPTPVPPPPRGVGGLKADLPDLTVELDDAAEADGEVTGAVHLSAPLTGALSATVQILFPGSGPEDLGCPTLGPGCPWTIDLAIPAGTTTVPFEVSVVEDDGPEATEVVGAAVSSTWPTNRVDVGPGAEAYLFDGDGLDLSIPDEAEVEEGDPGDDRTLEATSSPRSLVPKPHRR